jgi:hypothetical protein
VDEKQSLNEELREPALPKRPDDAADRKAQRKPGPSALDEILFMWNRRDALVHTGRPPEGHRSGHGVRQHELND